MPDLPWWPTFEDWHGRLAAVPPEPTAEAWSELVALAKANLDLIQTTRLDRALAKRFGETPPADLGTRPVRLAVLGSGTLRHLLPGLRVGALRRGLWLHCFIGEYEQYRQELIDPSSALHVFRPEAILFAFDACHLVGTSAETLRELWRTARQAFGCRVIQQTILPLAPELLGENEHRQPESPSERARALNAWLREHAEAEEVDLLSLDRHLERDGVRAWHDPALWYRAKQEVHPAATPLYGDLVARLLAAQQGRSAKCLVLDLDNTLWGGVVGDDGLAGLRLGQGSADGEAFVAMQEYCLELSRRGVVLAVCSKNDEPNVIEAFEKHPEMRLRRGDIAAFAVNWDDKAHNLRQIAENLRLGLDSFVFVDDNPVERALVRRELTMVAVPELPEDPADYPRRLADAGYFEALRLTDDDLRRARQYQENSVRDELRASVTDLGSYLAALEMRMHAAPFDEVALRRVVQLINKTNQFNLTTRRYTEPEVRAFMERPEAHTWQIRLRDRFGDNGLVACVIAVQGDGADLVIDTWLMSCRVLGRTLEEATLNLLLERARELNAPRLIGEYRPTEKNGMVADLYPRLGFVPLEQENRWALAVPAAHNLSTPISQL